MKTEIIDHSPTRKELRIEVPAETVRAEMERVLNTYTRRASVPGFRPGHAPASVVKQRFKDDINTEVLRTIVPQALTTAVEEKGLEVIGEPDVHLADEEGMKRFGTEPFAFHAHLEVFPNVEVKDYKGVEVARRVRPVTDEDVERVIESLRESSASMAPIEDRPSQQGDTVTINISGRYVGEPEAEEIKADEVDVVIGGDGVLPIFSENLTGVREGDERTFTVNYPEDFSSKGLAGKVIEYTAKVVAVRVKELPELDDEFAKGLGEADVETMDALRERIRTTLQGSAQAESENRLRNDLMNKLIAANGFEVPQSLIERQSQQLLESTVRNMFSRGIDPRGQDFDWTGMREAMQEQAIDDLRGSIILEQIADAENLDASQAEIDSEISDMATSARKSVAEIRDALTKQGGDLSIAERLRHRKALDLLIANANIHDEEWREEEEETATAEDETSSNQTAEASTETGAGDTPPEAATAAKAATTDEPQA